MLNPNYARYAERVRDLIGEGQTVARLEKPSSIGPYIQGQDTITLQAWLMKVANIIETTFGMNSAQFRQLAELMPKGGVRYVSHSYEIYPIIGLLSGALDDLEKGYLSGQELLIAGELFDSVIEQAKYLNSTGYKDVAAVLGRVVLEGALQRLATASGLDSTAKASQINDKLRANGTYTLPQWRLIQVWLDIGNSAAHGKFNEYDTEDVTKLLEGVAGFVAGTLHR